MTEVSKNFRVRNGLEVGGDGTFEGTVTADSIQFDTTYNIGSSLPGELTWNNDEGTLEFELKDGDVVLQIGQEQVLRVENNTGSTIPNGAIVYISGSSGFKPRITLANATSETTSSKTFGMVTSSSGIAHETEGYVTISGLVRGIDTTGISAGTGLWLSTTAGQFTATRPVAPNHGVFIGWVVKSGSNGEVLVHIQNGYEIDELHDVLIDTPTNGQVLKYDNGIWVNGSVSGSGGVTVSENPPSGASQGDLWFESDTTRKYIWYDSYWVEAAAPVSAIGLLDGGAPNSNYGGITTIDAGGVG